MSAPVIRLDLVPDRERHVLVAYAYPGNGEERCQIGSIALGPACIPDVFEKFKAAMQAVVAAFMRDEFGEGVAVWLDQPDREP